MICRNSTLQATSLKEVCTLLHTDNNTLGITGTSLLALVGSFSGEAECGVWFDQTRIDHYVS